MRFLTSRTKCSSLNMLSASYNLFHGELPQSVGNLSVHLREIYLGGNQPYGTIPLEMGKLAKLQILKLGNNHLAGPVPSSTIGRMAHILEVLAVHDNWLRGQIPTFTRNLTRLVFFYPSDNFFSGFYRPTIPSRSCQLI